MSAGRRGLILSVVFLGLALWLCPDRRAVAQPVRLQPNDPGPGKHKIWNSSLPPDQIREMLGRFGQGDGKDDPFEDVLRRLVRDKNPDAPKDQVDDAVKRFMNDKEFRDRIIDLAQRQKNQMRDGGNNGPPPKLTPEDRAKLEELARRLNIRPDGQNGGNRDPFKLPEEFAPFDPRNPQFDPKRFPAIDPNNPPKFDKDTRFPLDPRTGRPFDPRNGDPIDPKNPPRIDPPQPKLDPANPPKVAPPQPIDPKGRPPEAPNNDGKRRFDPENPLGPANDPDKLAKTKAVEAATAVWEKNVGPIDESPAVKKALIDLVSDNDVMDALTDSNGRNFFEAVNDGDGDKFGDLFGGDGGGWEWPKFDFNFGRGRDMDIDVGPGRRRELPDMPSRDYSSSRGSGLDMGSLSIGSVKVPFLLLLILTAVIIGAVVWWKWGGLIKPRAATAGPTGPPPWPVDPRAINTREDVVKAFEYLSVLICGADAKMWTHSTIADELSKLAATHGETAVKLARLYELARYAPLDEPLTKAELMEARRLVCDLAGMD